MYKDNMYGRIKNECKTKIGLGIMAPLFALAVGYTVNNKINQQKQAEQEYLDFHHDVDLMISKMSMAKDAEFKAKLNMDSLKMTSEQAKEMINLFQEAENKLSKKLSQKVTNDVQKYLKEE